MSGRQLYLKIMGNINNVLNPALCISCGIPLTSAEFICPHCYHSLEKVITPCLLCGLPNKAGGSICPACLHRPPRWQKMVAPLVYQAGTRKIIRDLKFNEQIYNAKALLTHIQFYYTKHNVETLIPVPLHKSRLLERGFNQSQEIASILSSQLNIPLDLVSLKRVKATQSQSGLSLNKRQVNILKAFEFTPTRPYKSVAIIDDIITTGSTVSEICKVMKKSGVQHIEVWSLARALKHD